MSQEQGVHRRGVKSANCIHPRVENCIQAKFHGDVLKDGSSSLTLLPTNVRHLNSSISPLTDPESIVSLADPLV